MSDDFQGVDQRRAGDDGGAVLVVVEDRDVHGLLQFLLDVETLGRLDVLQVDAAEGRLEQLAGLDDLVRIFRVELDVEDVDVGKAFEEDPLAFHDRLPGQGARFAQPEDRGAVGDHRHQIALGGVLVGILGVLCDFQTGLRDPGRVCQGQVA